MMVMVKLFVNKTQIICKGWQNAAVVKIFHNIVINGNFNWK